MPCVEYAQYANDYAQKLAAGLEKIDGFELLVPVESNGVFVDIRADMAQTLRDKGWKFYDFISESGARLMCS